MLYALRAGHPWNGRKAVSGMARPQGGGLMPSSVRLRSFLPLTFESTFASVSPRALWLSSAQQLVFRGGVAVDVVAGVDAWASKGGEFHDQADNVKK